jgi:hypothetical protein
LLSGSRSSWPHSVLVAAPALPHELSSDHVKVAQHAMELVNEATKGALRQASIQVEVNVLRA